MAGFHVMANAQGIHVQPAVRRITTADLMDALRLGFDDFWAKPSHYVFLCLIYPIVGLILTQWSSGSNAIQLVYPLMSGFALIGPFAAIGLYEISRRRELGMSTHWRHALDVRRSPALPSIAVIGILLFMALGSFAEAGLVFACVPLALVGGALSLLLRGMPFSVSAAVGFIAVSGVATLTGLVLMQAIRERLQAGQTPRDAALLGAFSRLRAVLTTAMVAIVGFIPMAIASGAGAEVQKPLATVVIGGLLTATALTLLVLPTFAAKAVRHRKAEGIEN